MANRERLLTETFVVLADTLVRDFDMVDFLSLLSSRCVDLFGAADAGLMIADADGHMHLAASSSHRMELLELLEIQHDEGPCPDAFRAGHAVTCDDLRAATDRWPTFAPEASSAGFRSAHALPMRLRDDVIGALNLLGSTIGPMAPDDILVAQALADVATIGILQHRAAQEAKLVTGQLQYALRSRIVIEQAKGAVAHQLGVDMDQAFNALRQYSRDHNQRLITTANAIIDRSLDGTHLDPRGP